MERIGDWYLIRWQDSRGNERRGYIHCADVSEYVSPDTAMASAPEATPQPTVPPAQPATSGSTGSLTASDQPSQVTTLKNPKVESRSGYLEWRRDGYIVVDGQRVRWTAQTRFKGNGLTSIEQTPLGFEVSVRGRRSPDGSLLAESLEVKPNGTAMFEEALRGAAGRVEDDWLSGMMMIQELSDGRLAKHALLDSGPKVERARRILRRLTPPYVSLNEVRVRIVDLDVWNAAAMPNGAIWLHSGLADDLSDDELAVILGHELAHYTHEHTRRQARNSMWASLAAVASGLAIERISNPTAATIAAVAKDLGLRAWTNGYSRNQEDQADRIGLRYAHEGGFDVTVAPALWEKFRRRYGQLDRVSSVFLGSHSRPSDRKNNVEAEIRANYGTSVQRAALQP